MKPKHQRLAFVAVSMVFFCLAVLITMQAFKENLIYFYSPSQVAAASLPSGQIRLGGLVETGSLRTEGDSVRFRITDGAKSYEVHYTGLLPNLFREGQGVVTEGSFAGDIFNAKRILAKHDENYMPPEVVNALKESGRWREGGQ